MKLIKRLVGIVLVLLLAAVLFLVPSSINPNEQLKNVQANTSWESMIEPTLNNANATAQGVSTEVSLNSVQLNQLLKSSLTDSDNQELLNGAYSIEGNKLRIQYPVKLFFIDSKLNHFARFYAGNNFVGFLAGVDAHPFQDGSFCLGRSGPNSSS